jgi:hypothetical protein
MIPEKKDSAKYFAWLNPSFSFWRFFTAPSIRPEGRWVRTGDIEAAP